MSTPLCSNRERIKALLAQLSPYLKQRGKTGLLDEVSAIDTRLRSQEVFVVVCGEFKMGKSTLINALLEQPGLCPTDADIATSAVSMIRYGEKPKATRHYGEPTGGKSEEIPVESISKYCVGQAEDIRDTFLLEIEVPNSRLKAGMVLMDTPGAGGMDARHSLLTSYFMPKADIVLYVIDGSPLTTEQIRFLRETVVPRSRHIIFVLNRADLHENIAEKLADARTKLESAVGGIINDCCIMPLSSRLKLRYLETKNPENLAASNFGALERKIPELLDVKERELQLECLGSLCQMVNQLKAPLYAQSEEHQRNSAQQLQELEARCKERKAKAEALVNPHAEFRRLLGEKMEDTIALAQARLKRECAMLNQNNLNEYLDDLELIRNPDELVRKLAADVEAAAQSIDTIIGDGLDDIVKFMMDKVDLDLEPIPQYTRFQATATKLASISDEEISKGKRFQRLKAGFFGFGIGSGLLHIGAIVTGATFATPLIVGAGLIGVVCSIKDNDKMARREKIRRALVPVLTQYSNDLESYIGQRIRGFRRYVDSRIMGKANAAIAAHTEVEQAFEAVRNRTKEESASLQKTIQGELRLLDVVARGAETLGRALEAKGLS